MNYPGTEIMAPVGSFEALSAAIQAGCNSVYFGVEQLNMRARSFINFTTDDLVGIDVILSEENRRKIPIRQSLAWKNMSKMKRLPLIVR